MSFRQGIDMDGDKKVGLVFVCNLRPTIEFNETVGLTGIDNPDIGSVALYELAKGQSELQGEVFLLGDGTSGPCIMSTVPRINDQRELICSIRRYGKTYPCYQKEYNLFTHIRS